MMKKTFASLLALALASVPVTSAVAGGRHHGGYYYGVGPIWGLGHAIVATAAAIITAPIAVLAAVAQAPLYYAQSGPLIPSPRPLMRRRPTRRASVLWLAAGGALLRSDDRTRVLRPACRDGLRSTSGSGVLRSPGGSTVLCVASGLLRAASGLPWSTPRLLPATAWCQLLPTLGIRWHRDFCLDRISPPRTQSQRGSGQS